MRLVAEGLGNREISELLALSEHTVKIYLFRIFDKLGISNRVELVLYAVSDPKGNTLTSSDSESVEEKPLGQDLRPKRVATRPLLRSRRYQQLDPRSSWFAQSLCWPSARARSCGLLPDGLELELDSDRVSNRWANASSVIADSVTKRLIPILGSNLGPATSECMQNRHPIGMQSQDESMR